MQCSPVGGSDTGDYFVRNLMGIDPNKGWIAIGDQIESGDGIMFTKRDRATANADLVQMLERLKNRINRPIQGGLYFSCLSRGHNLFGDPGVEMAILRDHGLDVAPEDVELVLEEEMQPWPLGDDARRAPRQDAVDAVQRRRALLPPGAG